jgi:SAM-dependent methyltransferase
VASPTQVAALRAGEVVLDLGCGGGIDVLLAARRVGPTGRVYGLDMTPEMVALARRNVREAGATNVEILQGEMEAIPLATASVDVVISNCVVNLSPEKPRVFAEVARVLRPGGRLSLADIVAEDRLRPSERAARGSYAGCVAGALSGGEYEQGLRHAGLEHVSVTFTHPESLCCLVTRRARLVTMRHEPCRGGARRPPAAGVPPGRQESGLGLAPTAEDEAAQGEAEPKRPQGEGTHGQGLPPGGEPLPAAERRLLLGRQRLALPLLAQGAAGP